MEPLKRVVRGILPDPFYRFIRKLRRSPALMRACVYDRNRYAKSSAVFHYDDSEAKLRAMITALYHNIEKGLSLTEPRLGFGVSNIELLIQYIDEMLSRYGARAHLATPISVLGSYVAFHEKQDYPVLTIRHHWERLLLINDVPKAEYSDGGVRRITRSEIAAATKGTTRVFFDARFSVRQFSDQLITRNEIANAVEIAQKSPVVCNRQSGRVHAYLTSADIQQILALHGGARGFSTNVSALFCITVDIRNFNGVAERNQGWIDGGLFAMCFLLGLHSQTIGSCCLNWSKNPEQDLAMRALLNLPQHENIIMFVAAGHIPHELNVAKSLRKPLEEVLQYGNLSDSRLDPMTLSVDQRADAHTTSPCAVTNDSSV